MAEKKKKTTSMKKKTTNTKKTSTNKTSTKKSAVAKKSNTSKKTPRKSKVQKSVPKKQTFQDFIHSTSFLSGVFVVLVVFVVILGLLIHKQVEENKDKIVANLNIPIIEVDAEYEFQVDALALSKEGKYIFKIKNYRGEKVNSNEITYQILIENSTNAEIALHRNKEEENLIENQESTLLEESLIAKEKEDIYYTLTIVKHEELKEDDFIRIKISS